ncbi:hypothetical protein IU500_18730 [Nocardia terpenica]|uniref:hypothetical protein n=1 Tax=Nocardia terpenica TaxID=455432 RepID=UPI001894F7FB|nr:hypothetical protein [Nocardia terpenica]MBF6063523.1 hypothetical protein [Nocardia terpenica]MBF6106079.1 hypothetical protein [Nocardia terpenica]MBF6113336.1 hypothetical protein [Nocardia terpenica]MBF6119820.1 hypothetical protein [Nocardia terpenica]MBF6152231.1 hypothetical protein [Nocardia terpenica]
MLTSVRRVVAWLAYAAAAALLADLITNIAHVSIDIARLAVRAVVRRSIAASLHHDNADEYA